MIKENKKQRESGIELLRIVAMLFIIAHHFALHTGWPDASSFTFNLYYIELLKSLGKIGAAIFFIIFGYFLAKSKMTNANIKKIFKTAIPTWFYSITIFIVFTSISLYKVKIEIPIDQNSLQSIFPIISNAYWFVSAYIVLELLSPFIKKMLEALNNRELACMISIYVICCWEFGSISYLISNNYAPLLVIPSCILYSSIGFLAYRVKDKIKTKTIVLALTLSALVLLFSPAIINILAKVGYTYNENLFWQFDSPICIMMATSLFLLFEKIKLKSTAINTIASATFGVYLIHDNIFIRTYLWGGESVLNLPGHYFDNKMHFIILSVSTIAIIFVTCTAVELIRKKIFGIVYGIITRKEK